MNNSMRRVIDGLGILWCLAMLYFMKKTHDSNYSSPCDPSDSASLVALAALGIVINVLLVIAQKPKDLSKPLLMAAKKENSRDTPNTFSASDIYDKALSAQLNY